MYHILHPSYKTAQFSPDVNSNFLSTTSQARGPDELIGCLRVTEMASVTI